MNITALFDAVCLAVSVYPRSQGKLPVSAKSCVSHVADAPATAAAHVSPLYSRPTRPSGPEKQPTAAPGSPPVHPTATPTAQSADPTSPTCTLTNCMRRSLAISSFSRSISSSREESCSSLERSCSCCATINAFNASGFSVSRSGRAAGTSAVAGDRSVVKLCPDLASLLGMKSEDKLVTLCGHKAVLLLGTISF
jgi:hypothetical protein